MNHRMLTSAGLLMCLAACGPGQPEGTGDAPAVADNEQVQTRGANKDNWWDALPRPEWSAFEKIPQDQDWFEVYRVADDVYAIYEPGQFEEVMSFLIEGEERALLFDTGLGIGDMRRVIDQLTDLDVIVLNSHTHYDHIGGNWQFETIYGRDTAYTRGRTAGSPPEAVADFLQEGWVWKALPDGFDPDAFTSRPFEIDRYVGEGDVIDLGGRSLEILVTPGHAPDSICLLDHDNRLLFTGDGLADRIDAALTSHNVPVVESRYMTALGAAFAAIESGTASDYTISDGYREYNFDGFSIIVRDDGQPAGQ